MATTDRFPIQSLRLSNTITLYRPASQLGVTEKKSKTVVHTIIICAWFRGLPKHISKYIDAYQQSHPEAQLLLIESTVGDMLYTPYSVQRSRYNSVVDILKGVKAADEGILLHIFSNGGSNSAVQLAEAWRSTQGSPFPATSMVFDSCPGSTSLKLAGDAIVASCPPETRWWATIVVWTTIVPMYSIPQLMGRQNLVSILRGSLNDPELFPIGTRRAYLASPADVMVPFEDVVSHFEGARAAGFDAKFVQFDRSPHVSHIKEDPVRYWATVESIQG